jgi:hypothetical protein
MTGNTWRRCARSGGWRTRLFEGEEAVLQVIEVQDLEGERGNPWTCISA